jgi:hypothetical protein
MSAARKCLIGKKHIFYQQSSRGRCSIPPAAKVEMCVLLWQCRSIRLVHPPMQRMMHHLVYEVAFIADDSGTLIELLHFLKSLPQEMEPDW